jgi:hypothetical protein
MLTFFFFDIAPVVAAPIAPKPITTTLEIGDDVATEDDEEDDVAIQEFNFQRFFESCGAAFVCAQILFIIIINLP